MGPVILFSLGIIAIISLVAVAIMVFTAAGHALDRHIKHMQRTPVKTQAKLCCPPGLGCNDPDDSSRACLRREARRLGTAEEIHAIDKAWVQLNSSRGKAKRDARVAYHAQRDAIIKRVIDDAAERMAQVQPALPELPAHLNGPEVVTGTVERDNGAYGLYQSPSKHE